MDPTSYMNEIMNSAVSQAYIESHKDIRALEMIFGKVLSEPRDSKLKDQIARIDETVQEQLEHLHDLYNNPTDHGVVSSKVLFQKSMRDSYTKFKDRFDRTHKDMLAHDKGNPQHSKEPRLDPVRPAAANPVRFAISDPKGETAVFSIGHIQAGSNARVIINGEDVTDRYSSQVHNSPVPIHMPAMQQPAQAPRSQFNQLSYNAAMNETLEIPSNTSGMTVKGHINSVIKIGDGCSSVTVTDGVNGKIKLGAHCSNIRVKCNVGSSVEIGNHCSNVHITRSVNSSYSIGDNCTNIYVDNARVR